MFEKSIILSFLFVFFFSSRRRHTRYWRDWSSDVCSSDLPPSRRTWRSSLRRTGRRTSCGRLRSGRPPSPSRDEIGRASCREKSVDLGGRRIIKKKKNKANTHCMTEDDTPNKILRRSHKRK